MKGNCPQPAPVLSLVRRLVRPSADWCGFCDERTRLVDHGESVSRCKQCHPLARQLLPQYRRCQDCGTVAHTWDVAPCGSHRP
jgi:hypothetical protein